MDGKVKMRSVYQHAKEMLEEIGAAYISKIFQDGRLIDFVGFFPDETHEKLSDSGPLGVVQYDQTSETYIRADFVNILYAKYEVTAKDITEEFMNYIAE